MNRAQRRAWMKQSQKARRDIARLKAEKQRREDEKRERFRRDIEAHGGILDEGVQP